MSGWRIGYLCDPAKNETCRKHGCCREHYTITDGMVRPEGRNACFLTSKRECAKTDGNGRVMRVIVHRTYAGFDYEIVND